MDTIKIDSGRTKIIAHRGLSGLERENTCPAFVAAANRSYFGIETDVHITKDGKFVIIHDETTRRITLDEYNINVEESNYADIQNIVLPDLDGSNVRQDIKIPLLEEYVKICKKYDKICVLEVKSHFREEALSNLVEEIKKIGYIENVIFISFDWENCINLRKMLPEANIQWLTLDKTVTEELVSTLKESNLDLDIYYKKLTKEAVDLLHDNGIKVNCWTCDIKQEAEELVNFGVDFITTNILE